MSTRKLSVLLAFFLFFTGLPAFLRAQTDGLLNLSHVVNMGFADEVEGDQTGGWTDQGPQIDLGGFPTGRRVLLGIPFRILDPSNNKGRSVVVLRGRDRPYFPEEVVIDAEGARGKTLYFLHTCAWGGTSSKITVAEYEVLYEDETRETIPLRVGVEFTNWWRIQKGTACEVAWSAEKGGIRRGVNMFPWKNPHPEIPIRSITFRSRSRMPVPILLAITVAGETLVHEEAPEAVVTVDRETWPEAAFPSGDTSGTALDVGALLAVAPTKGKPVKVRERYWGVTLEESVLKDGPEDWESLTRRLAAYGCNLIRIAPERKVDASDPATWSKEFLDEKERESLKSFLSFLGSKGFRVVLDFTGNLEVESEGSWKNGEGTEVSEGQWRSLFASARQKSLMAGGVSGFLDTGLFSIGTAEETAKASEKGAWTFDPQPVVMHPESSFILRLVGQRPLGKRFLALWSSAFPSEYLAERPCLIACVAASQGWEGCIHDEGLGEQWANLKPRDLRCSPEALVQVPAVALAFRRGDLREAKVEWVCPRESPCGLQALAHRSGWKTGGPSRTENLTQGGARVLEKTRKVVNDNGQLTWQGNIGVLQVSSPRFQVVTGFLSHRPFRNTVWNVETSNEFASISAVSLTKESLQGTTRLLLTGATRSAYSDMVFSADRSRCLNLGSRPLRTEPLKATVVLHRLKPEPSLKVRALDPNGRPLKQTVKTRWANNDLYVTWVPGVYYLEVFKP